MAEIRFDQVGKKYRDISVIHDLNLTIQDGEFFTFVGPSGCGKSTVLNLIAGLVPITEGNIYFDNTLVNEYSPKKRDVAMVFQSYALYPHMTVYKNIAFPLTMKKMNKRMINEEVHRIAALLGIEKFLQRKPKELSGGQRQRVALGRAIIRKPKVFLMDEPLSNLDARLRIEMRAELKKLHHELNITTVYVTHDQSEALSLSERIAVLSDGTIQQCGTPQEVYLKPANIFVGGFIGSPPMNFIQGSVKQTSPLQVECNSIILSPPSDQEAPERTVILGIRPEDIVVSDQREEGSIAVKVLLVEPAGSFNWIDFTWGGMEMRGNSSLEKDIQSGGSAFMQIPDSGVLVFDEKTGKRL
jgi:multiple sugar transport system ATP-binding protein